MGTRRVLVSRLNLPLRGRDLAAGMLIWGGLVLIARHGSGSATSGSSAAVFLGTVVLLLALAYVRPYGRPWPLAQWRAWRRRRALAFATTPTLSMIVPSLTRSATGLVIGEWLGARLLDRVIGGPDAVPSLVPAAGALLILLVLASDALLQG
ncbi:MAG: hypothetical protein NVSMB65_11260 [Chloroflexota bacterium]